MPIQGIEFRRASTGEWVSTAERDPADEDGLRLKGTPRGDREILYENIPGNSWNDNRLANFAQIVQDSMLDVRIPRDSLPADHPYVRDGDPALEWLFWDGTDVVERLIVLENVTFAEGQLGFSLRRISRR